MKKLSMSGPMAIAVIEGQNILLEQARKLLSDLSPDLELGEEVNP